VGVLVMFTLHILLNIVCVVLSFILITYMCCSYLSSVISIMYMYNYVISILFCDRLILQVSLLSVCIVVVIVVVVYVVITCICFSIISFMTLRLSILSISF